MEPGGLQSMGPQRKSDVTEHKHNVSSASLTFLANLKNDHTFLTKVLSNDDIRKENIKAVKERKCYIKE